jgi:hypothetical protein
MKMDEICEQRLRLNAKQIVTIRADDRLTPSHYVTDMI